MSSPLSPRAVFLDLETVRTLVTLSRLPDEASVRHEDIRQLATTILNAPEHVCPAPDPQPDLMSLQTQLSRTQEELDIALRDFETAETATRELRADVVRLENVTDALLAQAPADRQPPAPVNHGPKIPDPVQFDGSRSALRPFVAQLQVKLAGNASRFPNAQSRLAYAFSLLKGQAFDQLYPHLTPTGINLPDVADLIRILNLAFEDPDRVGTAERELRKLRQGNGDFAGYFAKFQRLVAEAGWDANAKRSELLAGLSVELKQACISRDLPDGYDALVEMLKATDNKIRALAAELNAGPSRPSWRRPALASTPASGSNEIPVADQRTSNPNYHGPAPMELGAGGARKISATERSHRMRYGLCMYCGNAGHMRANCPSAPPLRPLRGSEASMSGNA
jgi:hypothetical protein